jgi:MFS transporter, DHA2 family, multidrug resistance protein
VSGSSGLGWLVVGFLMVYAGIAPLVVLGTDLVVGGAPPDKAGSAAALSQTATELGVALGIAILGSVGSAVYRDQMADAVPSDTPSEVSAAARDSLAGATGAADGLSADAAARLLEPARDAFANGLGTVATVSAVLVAGLAVAAAVLLRHLRPSAGTPDEQEAGSTGPEAAVPAEPEPTLTVTGG